MYDQFIAVMDYWEVYLDPQTLSSSAGSILYVSFLGVNAVNAYQVESFLGNTLTVGESRIKACYSLLHMRMIHRLQFVYRLESLPPYDLRANNILPKSAIVSWSTPPPNRVTPWGVVFNYQLILTEYAFGLPAVTANSTVELYAFTGLEEFNNYSVIIAAENQVGLGNYSFTLNFSTPQAGSYIPLALIVGEVNFFVFMFQHQLLLHEVQMELESPPHSLTSTGCPQKPFM